MPDPRVFTIPVGEPFLAVLADAILDGTLVGSRPDAAALADATVFLPTRRAGRALAALLADRAAGGALLLPRIVPLGDLGYEAEGEEVSGSGPAAISPLARRLVLAKLVAAWSARTGPHDEDGRPLARIGSLGQAVALAGDLEGLMDALETEDVAWADLAGAVAREHSAYFADTLELLRIASEAWPAILAELGAEDPARRRRLALLDHARRLAETPPSGPVIAAGSTGSIPATATLLAAIARLPQGAVVLPGLDRDLDAEAWDAIGRPAQGGVTAGRGKGPEPSWGHPQFMLKQLLATIGIAREDVVALGPDREVRSPVLARRRLLSEVMRPAATTEAWAAMPPLERREVGVAGTDGLALIEAADEREEALAIGVALREALETPGRTAALVTPDRALARRIAVELGRWGIAAADSAPVPMSDTPAGRLARLSAEAAASRFAPLALLALLAHPDVTLGLDRDEVVRAAAALEIGVLRGPSPGPGLDGIAAALDLRRGSRNRRDPLPRQNLSDRRWDEAARLLERLRAAFDGFEPTDGGAALDLIALAACHRAVLARLTEGRAGAAGRRDRGALDELFAELARLPAAAAVTGRFADYPIFLATLARGRGLAPEAGGSHPRLRILGLLEARLLGVDRVVLGGLDEGIWPPSAPSDAFLNRPMRAALGLSPPERRIGQSAHDVVELLGASDAIVTRAKKRDGKPTVPSRFLERMRSFLGVPAWKALAARGERYLGWAAALDAPRLVAPLARPSPRPGPARFPRSLSVTEIETLVRDPYAIYARHILRLEPLDPVGASATLAERGTLLHEVLATFAEAHPGPDMPANAEADLLQRGLDAFRPLETAFPELYALWWPDFVRIVPRFLDWEADRRSRFGERRIETSGRMQIPFGPSGSDTLTIRGTADRIELDGHGGAAIVDFKTGGVPGLGEVWAGFSPQLTLEAAILMAGGFGATVVPDGCPDLLYVKLGARAGLAETTLAKPRPRSRSLPEVVAAHVTGLAALAVRYGIEGAGYTSRPFPQFAARGLAYDHLARLREWSASGGPEAVPT